MVRKMLTDCGPAAKDAGYGHVNGLSFIHRETVCRNRGCFYSGGQHSSKPVEFMPCPFMPLSSRVLPWPPYTSSSGDLCREHRFDPTVGIQSVPEI